MSSSEPSPELASKPAPVPPRQRLAAALARLQYLLLGRWQPAAMGALILLTLILVWQAQQVTAARTALQSIQRAVDEAYVLVQRSVSASLESVSTAIENSRFTAMVATGTPESLAAAAERLQRTVPAASSVTVYAASPDMLLDDEDATLGYMRAAQLARAQGTGERQIGASVGSGDRGPMLSLVEPVEHEGRVVGYAALFLPFSNIERTLHSDVRVASGRIDVRLGPEATDVSVDSRGESPRTAVDVIRPLAGTDLWLTGTRAPPTLWLPQNTPPMLLWLLALGALAEVLILGIGARLRGAWQALLLRRRIKADSGPTLGQVMQADADAAPAPDAPPAAAAAAAIAAPVTVDPTIFRAYDIRGVVNKTLDADVARLLGQAIGSEARERDQRAIVVGRDGRLSGPMLVEALIEGLRSTGIDVIDIGQVPTPLVYFACFELDTGSGIAVTGSHNPPDYNGFKIVLGGETLAGEAIQALAQRIREGRFTQGSGELTSADVTEDYINRIADDVQVQRALKVVVDCGNGVTGDIGPRLLEAIGCEVVPLYADIDGTFPNHHPDPSEPDNLSDLILLVAHQDADLGIAFDGDGDRLGVVTRSGEIIYPDRLLMLFALDVLVRDPGATIIYDVKCTGHLQPLILRNGGSPLMWKTGHSLMKAKMRETGAALAGEMSGHFFFRERWYGFDDGIYSAARLLEIVAGDLEEREPEAIFAALPKGVSTPELKVATAEGENHAFVEAFCRDARFEDARLTTIDGLRADWADGWGLVRASNTTPSLVLRFDADSAEALTRIQETFRAQILAVNPDLKLPF